MMSVKVKTDFSAAPKYRAAVVRAMKHGVEKAAVPLAKQMERMIQKGGGNTLATSMPGSPPATQRGGLRKSIFSGPGPGLTAKAGAQVRYAAILERGGTVHAKKGYLTVPLSVAAQRLRQRTPGSLKNSDTPMRVAKIKGKLFLVAVQKNKGGGKGGVWKIRRGDYLFVLKKQITIRARPWAKPSVPLAAPKMLAEFTRASRTMLRSEVIGDLRRGVSGGGNK